MTASNKAVRKNTTTSRKIEANYVLHYRDANAAEILSKLKATGESCRTCHHFNHSSTDERTSKSVTICRLKNSKPVMYYNICHLHKKLNVTEMAAVEENKIEETIS